ncbi:precorrin-2 dehydrogenase/sirohydrochlorin ferrochelatase family protein [Methanocorpusculum vombati]|uniref:precorrin-2 dehydrogenase n=1 Tax=Methanocorpusculum vombati TaxID=3002864 RepID=A0ABT4IN71_9EURY|nr:bifunctional precorrin-2 dehydrogenase/sirohydrochlorin ferrochelatase [Methanocorpusculum vombati]MCZ9311896.1 bifunctional precorrin-2 dehydrogenase/sirohydrochlorin ferrochelatase [Methanocorpusculum sp.]MCZ0863185.1 bifunctional precorrin-2 dehydrogenase/sirohydrochlorin ferrochelatase [Methanocorpusculum vombati]MCZ9319823.1 bifunctional precorrin-2 dehydrogenase/sirohydrochlorin ferrochelatase [Methanocorpusculum sp.]MDE2520370.1 bifunctional precorrin-2 dehydrogenase/sirohydrochlorin 
MIPLMLDLSAKRILIFGAGAVGVRKARHFTGCRMTVVSRSISPDVFSLPQTSIKQMDVADIEDDNLRTLIEKHDIIIAALSDTGQNERIIRLAKTAEKWYNCATSDDANFLIPSTVQGKEYTIAVSTSGRAPAVPRCIREDLEERYQGLDNMILLLASLRERLKETVPDQEKRAEILRNILHDETIRQRCRENKNADDLVAGYL